MNLRREPVAIQTVITAVVNLLIVFNILHWTDTQIAAVNAVLVAILGTVVRTQVTPVVDPRDNQGRKLTTDAAA